MSDLTAAEQERVRAALRFLRAQYGMWQTVAKALRVQPGSLAKTVAGRRKAAAKK